MLRGFLDRFGFEYEFASSTDYYTSGRFDATLLKMLERYDEVMAIMLPSLREERRRPIRRSCRSIRRPASSCRCRSTSARSTRGTIVWRDPDTGERFETPVTGGHVKLQWKPDWAMRWAALGVDYEMSGKDLIDSVKLAAQICRALGAPPPEGFNYELFLDEKGQKISKSKGNGLTIDEWLTYAPTESLGSTCSRSRRRRRSSISTSSRAPSTSTTRFLSPIRGRTGRSGSAIRSGTCMRASRLTIDLPVPFALLLNLVSASNAQNKACCGASSRATRRA